jgi:cystathionine gamma-synthase
MTKKRSPEPYTNSIEAPTYQSASATAEVVDRLKVPFMASNFGAPHTLVEQSTFFTYFEYDDAGLASIGVDRSTIRLALGYVNDPDQIIEDLAAALP